MEETRHNQSQGKKGTPLVWALLPALGRQSSSLAWSTCPEKSIKTFMQHTTHQDNKDMRPGNGGKKAKPGQCSGMLEMTQGTQIQLKN